MRSRLYSLVVKVRHLVRHYKPARRYFDRWADSLAGHEYESAEPSPSGKSGWRCRWCSKYSNAPVKTVYDPCHKRLMRPEKYNRKLPRD